jgi:hypothetical protein
MTWWCFDRDKLKRALDDYHGEVLNPHGSIEIVDALVFMSKVEEFLYSDQMKRLGNCRDDDGQRDYAAAAGSAAADEGGA